MQASSILSRIVVIGLATFQLPPFHDRPIISTAQHRHKRLVGEMESFWLLVCANLTSFKFSLVFNTSVHFQKLGCVLWIKFCRVLMIFYSLVQHGSIFLSQKVEGTLCLMPWHNPNSQLHNCFETYHEQFLSSSWIRRLQLICLILATIYKILTGSLVQSWAVIFWVDKQWSWVRFSLPTPKFFFSKKNFLVWKWKISLFSFSFG